MTDETEYKPEWISIRVIETQGKSAVIQTADFKRYYAPVSKIKDGKIERTDFDKAAFYGIPWEAYLGMDSITTEALALMLRQAGIYTLADLRVRDRQLIRIGTNLIGQAVRDAANRADKAKPPRRK